MKTTWFITGSSRGLGRALVQEALNAGHRVVGTARNPKDLEDFERYGDQFEAVALDVTDEASIKAAVAAAGRIDVLVNNAGYANLGAFEDVPARDFRAQVETNFFGVVNTTRAVLPLMRAQKTGHIIQISSIGGRLTSSGLTAYQASKFAVGGFSEALNNEVSRLGIKVTVVEPGGMDTDWAGSSMKIYEPSAPYRDSVGAFNERIRRSGVLRGDPKKCARAILEMAASTTPPMRFLLGTDAVFLAAKVIERRSAEDAAWRALSASSDRDGIDDFANSEMAKHL